MENKNNKILEGIQKYNEGEYEIALNIFDSCITDDKSDILALYYKGNTLGALGEFENAIKIFDLILTIDPDNKNSINSRKIFDNILNNTNSFKETVSPGEGIGVISESVIPSYDLSENNNVGSFPMSPAPSRVVQNNNKISLKKDKKDSDNTTYDFLKSKEIKGILDSSDISKLEKGDLFIGNDRLNKYDKDEILILLKNNNKEGIIEFIKKIRLRNLILDYLANSNILPPRKYNTIVTQIENINAEFALAFLMFNLSEKKYNEILLLIGEKPISENTSVEQNNSKDSEKIGILKIISSFFISIFSFEKSFSQETNKLKYFRYLFFFLGFISVLILIGYGIKNNAFKADIKVTRTTTASGVTESYTDIRSNF